MGKLRNYQFFSVITRRLAFHANPIRGKVVVVTGASSGIGRAIALECATRGCRVVIAARRTDRLAEVEASLRQLGAEVLAVQTDVSDENQCKLLIDKTIAQFGQIDVLVCNAGISMRALLERTDLLVLEQVMQTNFWGTVFCTKFALPWLLKTKGSIVGISSTGGFKGLPGRTGYSASKFAMHGFLESLRIENMKKGLHVLLVCPGFTTSEIREKALNAQGLPQGVSPLKETGLNSPEKVARRTMNALVKRRRLLILTLEGKMIIALQRIFPTLLDHVVYRQMAKEPDSPFR